MRIGPQQVNVGTFIKLSSSRISQLLLKTPASTTGHRPTAINFLEQLG
jgi:hypothetical protein